MPVTTPLTTLADDQAAAAAAAVTDLTTTLQDQDAALPAIRQAVTDATAALAGHARDEAGLRMQLCQIVLPADSEPLVTSLENVLVTEQGDRAQLAGASDDLARALRRRATTAAQLADASSRATVAAAAATVEHAAAEQEAAWLATAHSQQVSDAISAAGAASGTDPYQTAQGKVKDIVDSQNSGSAMYDLLARRAREARNRDAAVADSASRAVNARNDLEATRSPLAGARAKAETAYARVVAELGVVAQTTLADYAGAIASLTAIAAAPGPTTAEDGAITVAADDAAGAAPHETAIYDANDQLRSAQAALDQAVLQGIASNPDFDADTDPSVTAQRDDVNTKKGDVQNAKNALTADEQLHLDTYEAAIPEAVKALIVAFFTADATLSRVAAIDVGDLENRLTSARNDLATARANAASQERSATRLDGEVGDRTAEAAAWQTVAPDRGAALIKGEGSIT